MCALVISAFPGCGKTTFYNNYKHIRKILDSDSSDFSWLKDGNGYNTKERNPEFPTNYIKHIKNNLHDSDIIFVSSHDVVRKALAENKINYINVYPKDNIRNMKEWRNRFIARGNTQSFIDIVMENWRKWIKSMQDDIYCIKRVELDLFDGYSFIDKDLIKSIL